MRIKKAYGSKRHAAMVMLRALRGWAKAKRAHRLIRPTDIRRYTTYDNQELSFGIVLGASTALSSVGAWDEQCQRIYDRHFKRINKADVTRGVPS